MMQVLGQYLKFQFTEMCFERNMLINGKRSYEMYFLNLIFDYGNKTFKIKVSEKWECSSQTEFYNLSLYLKTFKSLYFEGFRIQKLFFKH